MAEGLSVQTKALYQTSAEWERLQGRLGEAKTETDNGLNSADLFGALANSQGIGEKHDHWVQSMSDALTEGQTTFGKISVSLQLVAADFDGTDDSVEGEMLKKKAKL